MQSSGGEGASGNKPTLGEFMNRIELGEDERTVFRVIREVVPEDGAAPGEQGDGGHVIGALEVVRKQEPKPIDDRPRAETPPRAHTFHDALSFASYVAKHGTAARTAVLADQVAVEMCAVLDEGAGGGVELLRMKPQAHPRWVPWRALCGRTVDLEDLVDFLRDHRSAIVEPPSRELMFVLGQIRCSISVEIARGKGADAINGVMVKTKVRGGGEESAAVDLPESVTIQTPVYVGGASLSIKLDLVIDPGKDGKTIVARLSKSDADEAEIAGFEQEVEVVRKTLGEDGFLVGLGSVKHGDWKRLERCRG